jgi:hypothetical protein
MIAVRVDRRDLAFWTRQRSPVILGVYDAARDVAYWLHIQDDARPRAARRGTALSGTVTLRIPISQILNQEAVCEFARLRDRMTAEINRRIFRDD